MSAQARSLQALGVVLAFLIPLLLGGGAAAVWWSGSIEAERNRERAEAGAVLVAARTELLERLRRLESPDVLVAGLDQDRELRFPFVGEEPLEVPADPVLATTLEIAAVHERRGNRASALRAFDRARELAPVFEWSAVSVLSSARVDAESGFVERALADLEALAEAQANRSIDLVTVGWIASRQAYSLATKNERNDEAQSLLSAMLNGDVPLRRGTAEALVRDLGAEGSEAGRRLIALDRVEELLPSGALAPGAYGSSVLVDAERVRVFDRESVDRVFEGIQVGGERWSVLRGVQEGALAEDLAWPELSAVAVGGGLPSERLLTTVRLLALAAIVTLVLGQFLVWRVVRRELALSKMKTEFVDLVGHELRTPIAALTLKSEMLSDGGVPAAKVEQYQRDVHRSALRLGELVGRILDFARLERGRFPLEPRRVSTRRLLAEALRRGREATALAGQRLRVEAGRALPDLEVDVELVTRALRNLIENAARHAGSSSAVEVQARAKDGGVEILVRDEGPGLQGADPKTLFEPFLRGEATRVQGSGLGLAIVERAARVHGGQVRAADRSDRPGAVFTLWLPAAGGVR